MGLNRFNYTFHLTLVLSVSLYACHGNEPAPKNWEKATQLGSSRYDILSEVPGKGLAFIRKNDYTILDSNGVRIESGSLPYFRSGSTGEIYPYQCVVGGGIFCRITDSLLRFTTTRLTSDCTRDVVLRLDSLPGRFYPTYSRGMGRSGAFDIDGGRIRYFVCVGWLQGSGQFQVLLVRLKKGTEACPEAFGIDKVTQIALPYNLTAGTDYFNNFIRQESGRFLIGANGRHIDVIDTSGVRKEGANPKPGYYAFPRWVARQNDGSYLTYGEIDHVIYQTRDDFSSYSTPKSHFNTYIKGHQVGSKTILTYYDGLKEIRLQGDSIHQSHVSTEGLPSKELNYSYVSLRRLGKDVYLNTPDGVYFKPYTDLR